MSPEQLLGELERNGRVVIADLEAGIGTALRLRSEQVDVVVVVAEPTVKSLEVAEKVVGIAGRRGADVVVAANRVTGDADVEMIRHRLASADLCVIPHDESVTNADRDGRAPIDLDPESPAVVAIAQLADHLMAREAARVGNRTDS